MSNVYLFGAGASCEYKAKLPGTLFSAKFLDGFFLDYNFFDFVDVMWDEWLKGGAQTPDHYDGSKWSWPVLEELLEQSFNALRYRLRPRIQDPRTSRPGNASRPRPDNG